MNGAIGTSHNRVLNAAVRYVVHLSMQETGFTDGADFCLLRNPFRAFTSDALLLQPIRQLEALVFDLE